MSRQVRHRYVDPLAQVWLGAATRIGLRVVRSSDAYASTDGAGTLVIGDDASLDADDSLAQMIFHELCHSLIEGPEAFARADWGMDNVGDDDVWREHACLRLQAALSARHGLRGLFAPTTDFRAFWDALPADPLTDRAEPSVQAAILGLRRVSTPPWSPALDEALAATAVIATQVARLQAPASSLQAPGSSLQPPGSGSVPVPVPVPVPDLRSGSGSGSGSGTGTGTGTGTGIGSLTPLWSTLSAPPPPHPTGLPAALSAPSPDRTCGTCAWRFHGGPGRATDRCRQADNARIDPAWPACERHEPALDCQTCGACCRAAYHSVEVSRRDPAVRAQPDYIVDRGTYLELRRAGDRCAALGGGDIVRQPDGTATTTRYACAIYDDRPRTCRDFTLGSAHCLTARRRVGLSR